MAVTLSYYALTLVKKIYENKAIYNRTNKAFNSYIEAGADKVIIPAEAVLSIIDVGTDPDANAGTDVKGDTTEIDVTVVHKMVRLLEKIVAKFNSKGGLALLTNYIQSAMRKLQREYNKLVIAEAFTTTHKVEFGGSVLALEDLVAVKQHFDDYEFPEDGRVMVVASQLQQQLWAIDFAQKAAAYNIENLKTGVFVDLLGFTLYVSSLNPKVDTTKKTIVAWHEDSLAFLLANETTIKNVYVPKLGGDINDIITHSAYKLLNDDAAYVAYEQ